MSLAIVSNCIGCWACDTVCPNGAIRFGTHHHEIDAARCDECAGTYADPQCASICPVEGAIVDTLGEPLNPPGSLGTPQMFGVGGEPADPTGVRCPS